MGNEILPFSALSRQEVPVPAVSAGRLIKLLHSNMGELYSVSRFHRMEFQEAKRLADSMPDSPLRTRLCTQIEDYQRAAEYFIARAQ